MISVISVDDKDEYRVRRNEALLVVQLPMSQTSTPYMASIRAVLNNRDRIEVLGERGARVGPRIRILTCGHADESFTRPFRPPSRNSGQKRFEVRHEHTHGTRR